MRTAVRDELLWDLLTKLGQQGGNTAINVYGDISDVHVCATACRSHCCRISSTFAALYSLRARLCTIPVLSRWSTLESCMLLTPKGTDGRYDDETKALVRLASGLGRPWELVIAVRSFGTIEGHIGSVGSVERIWNVRKSRP